MHTWHMTTTWKIVMGVFLAALIALACVVSFIIGNSLQPPESGAAVVELPNGDEVMCVTTERGGITCNWWMVTT